MKKRSWTYLWMVVVIGLVGMLGFTDPQSPKAIQQGVKAFPLPDTIEFAGEPMPRNDAEVLQRFDRELHVNSYWQSNTLLYFKRAHQYFPIMEPILKAYGVPEDFKYLSVAESALQQVVSPAGATGFWQLMKGTAQDYGLEVNEVVDERYHVQKATEAACQYLLNAYEIFGSWTAVAASYNMGVNGLIRQMKRQKCTNYYDLLLNDETSRYVFRILAIKEILEHPKRYGFHFEASDLYPNTPTKGVIIKAPHPDLAHFAQSYGISYKTLKYYNPWLRDNFLKAEKSEYVVWLPDTVQLNPKYNYPQPVTHLDSLVYYEPMAGKMRIHVVKRGENLSTIAEKYGVSLADLYEWNDLGSRSVLKVGQEIEIHGGK